MLGQSGPSQSCRWWKTGRIGWWLCWYLERHEQAREMTSRNLMNSNKETFQLLHLKRNKLIHHYMLGVNQLESIMAWGSTSNISQQCSIAVRKANSLLWQQQVEGGDPSLLLSTTETYLQGWIHFWSHQYEKNILEWVYWRAIKVIKELERIGCKSWDCSVLRRAGTLCQCV